MRQVADLVRGQDVDVALHTLQFVTRAAALPMRKLIESAAANAREKAAAEERRFAPEALFVKSIMVDEGPTAKRFRPRAQGRAFRIRKRTCHVTLILEVNEEEVVSRRQRAAAKTEATPSEKEKTGRRGRAASKAKTAGAAK
jgi:large subunit ribosomal protein L22